MRVSAVSATTSHHPARLRRVDATTAANAASTRTVHDAAVAVTATITDHGLRRMGCCPRSDAADRPSSRANVCVNLAGIIRIWRIGSRRIHPTERSTVRVYQAPSSRVPNTHRSGARSLDTTAGSSQGEPTKQSRFIAAELSKEPFAPGRVPPHRLGALLVDNGDQCPTSRPLRTVHGTSMTTVTTTLPVNGLSAALTGRRSAHSTIHGRITTTTPVERVRTHQAANIPKPTPTNRRPRASMRHRHATADAARSCAPKSVSDSGLAVYRIIPGSTASTHAAIKAARSPKKYRAQNDPRTIVASPADVFTTIAAANVSRPNSRRTAIVAGYPGGWNAVGMPPSDGVAPDAMPSARLRNCAGSESSSNGRRAARTTQPRRNTAPTSTAHATPVLPNHRITTDRAAVGFTKYSTRSQ